MFGGRTVTGAVLVAFASALMFVPSAKADEYPFCLPTEDPDCYFLSEVNSSIFPIGGTDPSQIIAKGKEACMKMLADTTGGEPTESYAASMSDLPDMQYKAKRFAETSALAYCPRMLPGCADGSCLE
jgi:hypothetical protein